MPTRTRAGKPENKGKLRIGDDWNAIRIIALSQNNPLKAVAEFVENSIDAGARHVTVTRGRERGEHYLRIADDGAGVPQNRDGLPDFRYVATHICDSVKRRLKSEGAQGIQGEFGIGLLSFWTVGENLSMTCSGTDGHTYTMHMRKGDPGYRVQKRRLLFAEHGTELKISPLLPGLRQLSGEKMQWYLASELRERIRQAEVEVRIVDRVARKEFRVEPRQFTGRLLHQLPAARTPFGDVYVELYLAEPDPANRVALYRHGTRVIGDLTELPSFQRAPWNEGMLQGLLDAPFLNITPATRTGLLHDERYAALCEALGPLEEKLRAEVDEQRRAESERASRHMLRTIHKAFREALLALPAEEYDWFDVHDRAARSADGRGLTTGGVATPVQRAADAEAQTDGQAPREEPQKAFFEYAGPLYSAQVAPASSVLSVGQSRTLRAVCRDRTRRTVEEGLQFSWHLSEGGGALENTDGEIVTYTAPAEPGLVEIALTVSQGAITCEAKGLITVTDSLMPESREPASAREGLPGYTFERAPGKLWRSRFNAEHNVVVINSGHRDFVHSSRTKALKLRYITRLYAKELVLRNFPGLPADQLLERLIELSLYTEEHLR